MNRRPALAALLALTLIAPMLSGCATTKKTPRSAAQPSPSPTAEELAEIRAGYKIAFPNARVGVVSAVDEASGYLLVDDVDTADLKAGQYVTFLDADQDPIANGKIAKVDGGVTVQFVPGKRTPRVGDAAVKF